MKKIKLLLTILLIIMLGKNALAEEANLENFVLLELKDGVVVIETFPDVAPNHVKRIKSLTSQGFYNGLKFHRVIKNFMVQTGDPTGTGMSGSDKINLRAEFNDKPHFRGAVSMARAGHPNSANSQFFIVTKDSRFLDKQYTVWGNVIDGMEYVDNIKQGDASSNGTVKNPDVIVKMFLASDIYRYDSRSIDEIIIELKEITKIRAEKLQGKKSEEIKKYKTILELAYLTSGSQTTSETTIQQEKKTKTKALPTLPTIESVTKGSKKTNSYKKPKTSTKQGLLNRLYKHLEK